MSTRVRFKRYWSTLDLVTNAQVSYLPPGCVPALIICKWPSWKAKEGRSLYGGHRQDEPYRGEELGVIFCSLCRGSEKALHLCQTLPFCFNYPISMIQLHVRALRLLPSWDAAHGSQNLCFSMGSTKKLTCSVHLCCCVVVAANHLIQANHSHWSKSHQREVRVGVEVRVAGDSNWMFSSLGLHTCTVNGGKIKRQADIRPWVSLCSLEGGRVGSPQQKTWIEWRLTLDPGGQPQSKKYWCCQKALLCLFSVGLDLAEGYYSVNRSDCLVWTLLTGNS